MKEEGAGAREFAILLTDVRVQVRRGPWLNAAAATH